MAAGVAVEQERKNIEEVSEAAHELAVETIGIRDTDDQLVYRLSRQQAEQKSLQGGKVVMERGCLVTTCELLQLGIRLGYKTYPGHIDIVALERQTHL